MALRGLAAVLPGMWLWAANTARFLPPWGWALWVLSALFLMPAAARRARPVFRTLGVALARRPATILVAMAAAALVLLLPDRTRFVGDFQLRQGSVEESLSVGRLFPQALPLDVFLHYTLPSWAQAVLAIPPNATSRGLGAIDAALLAGLAILFARRLGADKEQLPVIAALAGCGAWLALFTGYSKAFAEMAVLTAAIAVAGLDTLRARRSALPLALLVSVGLLLHRSGLGFLPAAAFVFFATRAARREPKAAGWAAAAAPLIALSLVAVPIAKGVGAYDAAHFLGREGGEGAGFARAAFSPLHLADVANLMVFLVPLAPLLALAAGRRRAARAGRGDGRPSRQAAPAVLARREWIFLLLLAAPFVLTLLFIHPAQGVPRDFDDFAAAGVAIALLLAATLAVRLRTVPGAAWLAPALLVASVAPPLEYMLVQADVDRGLARAEALVEGPPLRPAYERAKASEFLGSRLYGSGRRSEAVAQYARAVELGPSPNIIMGWALVAGYAGDVASEERALRLLLERVPPDRTDMRRIAYERLAAILTRRGDWRGARECADQAYRLDPGDAAAPRMRELIGRRQTAARATGSAAARRPGASADSARGTGR